MTTETTTVALPGFDQILRESVKKILAKLGDIQTRGSYTRRTSFTQLTGYPAITYRLGIARDPGFWTRPGDAGPSVERSDLNSGETR